MAMPMSRMLRLLLREALVPLFCAIIALSGVVQARAQGGKLANPAAMIHLAGCGPSLANPGDVPSPNHDCSDCSLPTPAGTNDWRLSLALRFLERAAPLPGVGAVTSGEISTAIPWSRGPPGAA